MVRFRTLGCYPLSGAIESTRDDAARDHPRDAADARTPSARAASSTTTRTARWRRRSARGTSDARRRTSSELIESDIVGLPRAPRAEGAAALRHVGSVDDGKSTLIGRLLHDSNGVYEDQLVGGAQARLDAWTATAIDFSLFTDGLKAEREQGITIDVAYRYFATEKRKFIIADTPGHVQYTRNMATGASTADVGVILIDARLGVLAADAPPRVHRVAARHPAPARRA